MRQYMGQDQDAWYIQLWEYAKGQIQATQEERKEKGLDPYQFTVVTSLGTVEVGKDGFTFTQPATGETKKVPADTTNITDDLLAMMRRATPSLLTQPLVIGGLVIGGIVLWRFIRK